ncbi:Piwi-domain-containing protein [Russula compacta]|nr:Piwi-domain-containing protein [Russula compacta]
MKIPPSRGDTCGTFTTDSQGTSGSNVRRGQAGHRGSRSPSVRRGRAPAPTRGGKPSGLVAPLIYSSGKPARVDSRFEAAEELVTRLRGRDLGPARPVRPGWGTQGRVIVVRTNFFPVELTKDILYEYTVRISPEPRSLKPHVKRRVLELFEKSAVIQPYADKIAHDGAHRLIAAQLLPRPLRDKVEYFEDGDDGPPPDPDIYTVEVTFSRELHTAPLKRFQEGDMANVDTRKEIDPLVSALNLILQRQAAQLGSRFGRNRYFFDDQKELLGPRLLAHMGFYSSVRPVHHQLMVNVNACTAAFYEPGKLSEALRAFDIRSFGAIPQNFMASAKVSTRYRGHKVVKMIRRISDSSARKQKFPCEEYGGEITVEDFFRRKYNIQLREADTLPVVDIGSDKSPVYVPAELCTVEPGEPHLGKLGPKESAAMLRCSDRRPAVNAQLIVERGLSHLGYAPSVPLLDAFGVKVSGEMSVIPARELPAPRVTYAKGSQQVQVQNGGWNLRNVKFHRGAKVSNWKVLVVRDGANGITSNDPALLRFVEAFANHCRSTGIDLAPKPSIILETKQLPPKNRDSRHRMAAVAEISRTMELFGDMQDVGFVLVLLPREDDCLYPAIKRLCTVKIGVHSQCLSLETALRDRGQDRYLTSVALKLNAKLGGVNHVLGKEAMAWLTEKPTIMVGIDVTHPSVHSAAGTPSIVGVVASIDNDFVQFPASLGLQKSGREVIRGTVLRDMIVERLQAYRRHSKALPERMIVFRDGVSQGQYDEVLAEELRQFFEAFKIVDPENPKYRPTLSIVICGKRHHARFFATNSADADKNGNTRPGTVVDKGVTSLLDFDFYLQAHAGIQGSAKSTHYVVIYDESKLTPDQVQQGVHSASYLYARATKAVSLVPPAYYADILCERARSWIYEFLLAEGGDGRARAGASAGAGTAGSGTKSVSSVSKRAEKENRVFEAVKRAWGDGLHANLRDSMFYI